MKLLRDVLSLNIPVLFLRENSGTLGWRRNSVHWTLAYRNSPLQDDLVRCISFTVIFLPSGLEVFTLKWQYQYAGHT